MPGRNRGRVLDYGCGDGRLVEKLADMGIPATGYDPDPDCIARLPGEACLRLLWRRGNSWRKLLDENARFDTVVCGRVLCTIDEDAEFRKVLNNLRRLVSDSGRVLVSVCNPFHLSTEATELWTRHLPADFSYESTFVYEKTVTSSGNRRSEVPPEFHLLQAGLPRRRLSGREGHGAGRNGHPEPPACLRPSRVSKLAPQPVPKHEISLLVKTCLMEWRTIEQQVRHLVGQLEDPWRFKEKLIVVDPSEGPFLRQYDRVDAEAHRMAMDRLLADGVVDRVVYAPTDEEVIRATYMKWFGEESTETHSASGQQLFATLYGFDSCSGDYVLQVDSDLLVLRNDPDHDHAGRDGGRPS